MHTQSNTNALATAHAYLAGSYTVDGYVYRDAASSASWLVSIADLADLGRRLERGDEDALSHWSAETSATEVVR